MSYPDIKVSQLQIIKHSLGLDRPDSEKILRKFNKDKKRTHWEENNRNYFAACKDSKDYISILELVELGLMTEGSTIFEYIGFFVTPKGKEMVGIIEKETE